MSVSPESPRVAVIGGGVSGLAAAATLHAEAPDARITLFESGDRLGGAVWTTTKRIALPAGVTGEFIIEQGADSLLIDRPVTVELLRRFGLDDDLLPTNPPHRRAFVVRRGKLVPIPEGFALLQPRKLWPFLASPILGMSAKLRAACELFIARRDAEAEESLADFARRRFGRQAYERLIEPLAAGIFTGNGEKLSLQAALPKFAAMEQEHGSLIRAARSERRRRREAESQADENSPQSLDDVGSGARYGLFVAPTSGMSKLTDRLAESLPTDTVKLRTAVTSLQRANSAWNVNTRVGNHNEAQSEFDAVILAAPAATVARLCEHVEPDLARAAEKIPYASSAVVSLAAPRGAIEHPLNGFGFVVPRIENRAIIAASFPSVKFPNRARKGFVLIRVFLGGALRPEMVDWEDERLRQTAIRELGELIGLSGEPMFADVARWRNAMPQYHVGHLGIVRELETRAGKLPGLELAGAYLRGVGIPQCLESGSNSARNVLRRLQDVSG